MNKRLSILTLCIVGLSMLFILIGTLFNNTNDNIVDIIGDKNSLENINILYQNKDGIFNTRETIISKDGLNIKQFSKELPDIYKYSKEAIDNRDLFKHMYDTATIYHDENEIGCFLENGYGTDDKGNMDIDFIIKNKNLKTNKIKTINKNVNIKLNNSKVSPYLLPSVITKYNGTVYMLLSHIEEIDTKSGVNNTYKKDKNTHIKIYTIDTDNENINIKEVDKLEVKDKNIDISEINARFVYDNKMYIMFRDGDSQNKDYIVYYDLVNKKFDYIKNPIYTKEMNDYDSNKYSIDDGKLNIITKVTLKKDDKYNRFYLTTIDLKNEKIINSNKEYKIEKINNYVEVEDLRVIDNKVCLLLNSYKYANIHRDIEEENIAKHVLILDENSQDILYMGKYSDGDVNYNVRYILKDDEL